MDKKVIYGGLFVVVLGCGIVYLKYIFHQAAVEAREKIRTHALFGQKPIVYKKLNPVTIV